MATPRKRPAEPAPLPDPPGESVDALIFDPPPFRVVIDGEPLTIGPLTPRKTWRLNRLLIGALQRQRAVLAAIQALPLEEQGEAMMAINPFDVFDEDVFLELVALVLSTPEHPVTAGWLDAHDTDGASIQVFTEFANRYEVLRHLGEATQAVQALMGQRPVPTPPPNGQVASPG